jgi:hypothetical protein
MESSGHKSRSNSRKNRAKTERKTKGNRPEKKMFRLKELDKRGETDLTILLPKRLTFKKSFDPSDSTQTELHQFLRESLQYPEVQDGAKIRTSPVMEKNRQDQ